MLKLSSVVTINLVGVVLSSQSINTTDVWTQVLHETDLIKLKAYCGRNNKKKDER